MVARVSESELLFRRQMEELVGWWIVKKRYLETLQRKMMNDRDDTRLIRQPVVRREYFSPVYRIHSCAESQEMRIWLIRFAYRILSS